MVIYENSDLFDRSNIHFNGEQIVSYSKSEPSSHMRYIDYGLIGIKKEILLKQSNGRSDLSALLSELVEMRTVENFVVDKRFYEIGSVSGMTELQKYLGDNAQ